MYSLLCVLISWGLFLPTSSTPPHPLRLSLCEIEYTSGQQLLTINLKLFLTDVNEAIVFDPYSKELAFCQPNESDQANQMLLDYLNQFFYVKTNGKTVDLQIKHKKLSGEGDNTALWVYFEHSTRATIDISLKSKMRFSPTCSLIKITSSTPILMVNPKA